MKAGRARTAVGMASPTVNAVVDLVGFWGFCRCPHEPGAAAALPNPPVQLLSSVLLPMINQLRAKKEREPGVGDHAGGTPAVLVACLLACWWRA